MPANLSPFSSPRLRAHRLHLALGPLGLVLGLAGCQHTVSDAALHSGVQNALASDPSIRQQPVQVAVQNGVVTLSGNVSDETASNVAAQDAAKVKGVKQVVNSLQVAGSPTAGTQVAGAQVGNTQVAPAVTTPDAPVPSSGPSRTAVPPRSSSATSTAPPSPPPAPITREVTAPAGTTIPVRITETLQSQTATDGEPFNGVVTQEIVHGGLVVLPAGTPVSGRVVASKDAGHFKGNSELSLELTSARRHGEVIPLSTGVYTLEGKGRGKNTAEKVGGGAAIGAVLGGIFGGGKGAGIGALAGGGGGTVLQGVTRGQQVSVRSESVIRFRLTRPLTVADAEKPSGDVSPTLRRR